MTGPKSVVLLGGCFWGTELAASRLPGVLSTRAGYAGGDSAAPPSYYSLDHSGHAEAVRVEYDPAALSFGALLAAFSEKSGSDPSPPACPRYRRAVLCADEAQAAEARAFAAETGARFDVAVGFVFHDAEERHQGYYAKTLGV
jgi:peptide methionine sulfoxide reductase MsrA